MKLIKEGRKPVFAKRFECPDCHSIFEAERGEYNTKTEEFMGTEYHAVCPFCGRNGYMRIKSREYAKDGGQTDMSFDCKYTYRRAPAKSGAYLVIAAEFNFYDGVYEKPRFMILEYFAEKKEWNTKADIQVYAWAELPAISGIP
jgi:hypothetical protein